MNSKLHRSIRTTAVLLGALVLHQPVWATEHPSGDPLGLADLSEQVSPVKVQKQSLGCPESLAEPLARFDAAKMALCKSEKFNNAVAQQNIALARYGQTIAAYLPQLNFSSTYSQRNPVTFFFDSRPELKTTDNIESQAKSNLTLSWSVFSSGANMAATEAGMLLFRASTLDIEQVSEDVILEALLSYSDLKAAQDLERVARDANDLAKTSVEIAQRREAGGIGSRTEILQAQSALLRSELEHRAYQEQRKTKASAFAALLRLPPRESFALAEDDAAAPGQNAHQYALTIEEMVALKANVRAAALRIEAARAKRAQVSRESLPQITMNAGASQGKTNNPSANAAVGREYSIGLALSIPLFEGFGRTYKSKEAAALTDSALIELESAKNKAETDIRADLNILLHQLDTLDVAQKYLDVAKQAYQAAKVRYLKGLADILEVMNSQRELSSAEAEMIKSKLRVATSQARVDRHKGQLLNSFLQ